MFGRRELPYKIFKRGSHLTDNNALTGATILTSSVQIGFPLLIYLSSDKDCCVYFPLENSQITQRYPSLASFSTQKIIY